MSSIPTGLWVEVVTFSPQAKAYGYYVVRAAGAFNSKIVISFILDISSFILPLRKEKSNE